MNIEGKVVVIAIPPVFARFIGADQGVAGFCGVSPAVPARGVVATADMAAGLTDAQMDPFPVSGIEAFRAAGDRPWFGDATEIVWHMLAGLGHDVFPYCSRRASLVVSERRGQPCWRACGGEEFSCRRGPHIRDGD